MSEYGTEQTCKTGIDRCVYMGKKFELKRIGMNEIEAIKELFVGVFTIEPWNDDCQIKNSLICICLI